MSPKPQAIVPLHLEPAVIELTGASFTAAALLRALAADDGALNVLSTPQAADWLAEKLADAAENLWALYAEQPPRWETHAMVHELTAARERAHAATA